MEQAGLRMPWTTELEDEGDASERRNGRMERWGWNWKGLTFIILGEREEGD